jgi:hypothetical protein
VIFIEHSRKTSLSHDLCPLDQQRARSQADSPLRSRDRGRFGASAQNSRILVRDFAMTASERFSELREDDATSRTNVAVTATKLRTGSGPLGVRS